MNNIQCKISAILAIALFFLVSCSTTKNIPEDDQLFVGLSKIAYENYEKGDNFTATQEEVEAALATAPNGALFGSSYYRTPFPYGLWIWNAYSQKEGTFAKWMTKSFGKQPVLMSWVNPALRASVAQSVLRNHGYFHGQVDYETKTMRNPKKAKIGYTLNMGPLLTVDSLSYIGFPEKADSIIHANDNDALLKPGSAFTASGLDAERTRISTILRNNGYYYYQPSYARYLADTTANAANLRLHLADDTPAEALHPWYMGHVTFNLQRTFMQPITDSIHRRSFTIRYNGRRSPVRPRVVMGSMRLRPRQPYSYDAYLQSVSALNATGLFSMTDFQFIPRDTTGNLRSDTLDLTVNCVFERPYDIYIETNLSKRTIGRIGPELKIGLTKRNVFRGGEKFDINMHGSYEWQTRGSGEDMNTYEYGADASIEFPRIVAPFFGGNRPAAQRRGTVPPSRYRRRWRGASTTLAKFSSDIVRRPGYYKMHIVSGEWTYRWQTTSQNRHEFSPLNLKYQYMNTHTEKFDSIIGENPYLVATMSDYFIPQIRYSYTYASPSSYLHPIRFDITVSEAGNLTSLGYRLAGHDWNEKEKELFKNPYAQFVKIEANLTKTWQLSQHSQFVGNVSVGAAYTYGNSDELPFSERFYVGGANSIRAFPLRTIGPGRFAGFDGHYNQFSYLMQNGDIKFQANLEYRRKLFGNLHGALFLDAGNVWRFRELDYGDSDDNLLQTDFKLSRFLKQLAVGTGGGLRYDLDFLILRIDWGVGLHLPYETTRSGFYNIDHFSRYQTLHFAIGYPF